MTAEKEKSVLDLIRFYESMANNRMKRELCTAKPLIISVKMKETGHDNSVCMQNQLHRLSKRIYENSNCVKELDSSYSAKGVLLEIKEDTLGFQMCDNVSDNSKNCLVIVKQVKACQAKVLNEFEVVFKNKNETEGMSKGVGNIKNKKSSIEEKTGFIKQHGIKKYDKKASTLLCGRGKGESSEYLYLAKEQEAISAETSSFVSNIDAIIEISDIDNQVLLRDKRRAEHQLSNGHIQKAIILNSGQEVGVPCKEGGDSQFEAQGSKKTEINDRKGEPSKQKGGSSMNNIMKRTPEADELMQEEIKPKKAYIDDESTSYEMPENPEINYTQANTAAIEIIRRYEKEKSIFQKIFEFFTCKPCCGSTIENTDQVNPKIYELVDHIDQNCCGVSHLFRTRRVGKNYKILLKKIRNIEEINFRKFTALDNVSALKKYLKVDLDGFLNVKSTEIIFKSLMTCGFEGEEALKNHGRYLIVKDRLVLLHKILILFVKIGRNFYRTKCRYNDLIAVLVPYIFPVGGISGVRNTDLLKAGRLICEPYDLDVIECILRRLNK